MKKPPRTRTLSVRPSFGSVEQALTFFSILAVLLCLPWIMKIFGMDHAISFSQDYRDEAAFSFYKNQIYEQQGDIDVLLVGPCVVWWQLEALQVESALAEKLGRPARVVNLGFNHFGNDLSYILVKEMLQHRRVHRLVLSTPRSSDLLTFPHPNAHLWWLYPDDIQNFSGLSFLNHLSLYAVSTMGALHSLPHFLKFKKDPETTHYFNSNGTKIRPDSHPEVQGEGPFAKIHFQPPTVTFRSWDSHQIEIAGEPPPRIQMIFFEKILELAKAANTHVYLINSPLKEDFDTDRLRERINWFANYPGQITLIGISPQLWKSWISPSDWNLLFDQENLSTRASRVLSRTLGTVLGDLP